MRKLEKKGDHVFWLLLFLSALVMVEGKVYRSNPTQVDTLLDELNKELKYFRHAMAELAWEISNNMSQAVLDKNEAVAISRNIWANEWCMKLLELKKRDERDPFAGPWSISQSRQMYLLCRGPRFTSYQLTNILGILSTMQKLYNKEVCFNESSTTSCYKMEPDLNRVMELSRDEATLRSVWSHWHRQIGGDVSSLYTSLIHLLNEGARQAGHSDMGECWRGESEIKDLQSVAIELHKDVAHLYKLLHALVRFKLEKFYKMEFSGGLIPTHLLGNMYAQNWQSLIEIVWEEGEGGEDESVGEDENPLVHSLFPPNATVLDMVKAGEDFFVSMGIPKMPPKFWENSYFEDIKTSSRNCHGSAANMFGLNAPDYRIMVCAEMRDEDLVTLQHEIGHVIYFMAYSSQPTIFQDGANSAFHEAVGDSVTYDLKRDGGNRMKSLLKNALTKLPQVGYGLVMDLWRWKVFQNEDASGDWNDYWWRLHRDYLGISKPEGYDSKNLLDATGKFHIVDNIPYIRYFLASFLQVQFYESMCKAAGSWDMHSCKIKGSQEAGKKLWNMMTQGTSRHWSLLLQEMTGSQKIESGPLLRYYEPLRIWLERKVNRHNLTVGW